MGILYSEENQDRGWN